MNRIAAVLFSLLLATSAAAQERWWFFFEELEIDRLVHRLSREHQPRTVAFVDVNLISMRGEPRVEPHQTVVVENGRIVSVGPAGAAKIPRNALRVNGRGRYLIPGLTDAHVHMLENSADHLLALLHGVTTVRDMCGFPWLLRHRDAVRANRVLAPTPYVASHILNGNRMGMYATAVTTPEEGERAVREQKRAGYAYIKTHNSLSRDVYAAILKTAAEENMRVIGHVPVRASVEMAIAGGHYTLEHFKGYLNDGNLTLSTDDWVTPTKGADIWLCPTFYTRVIGFTEDESRRLMDSPLGRLVSTRLRKRWVERSREGDEASRKVWALSQQIFARLRPVTNRWIAGTDSGGGYRNMIVGHALLDEVETFERLGLTSAEALKAATSNAASALLDEKEFGTVEAGKRADLVLLDRNPLETVKHLRDPRGVMVRGIWLDARTLASIRSSIENIYARAGRDASLDAPSDRQVAALVEGMTALAKDGWVYRDHQLQELHALLVARGRTADAERVKSWGVKK